MDIEKLRHLHQLKEEGVLSEEEFQQQKQKLLDQSNTPNPEFKAATAPVASGSLDQQQYAMFIHFSLLLGLVLPMIGLILPLVLWLTKKDNSYIDQHGRTVANWLISYIIYAFVSFLLVFLIIGVPMLIALAVCHVVFAILGGIKAKDGELWQYPLSIKFFKTEVI